LALCNGGVEWPALPGGRKQSNRPRPARLVMGGRRRSSMIVDCHVHALATTPGHGYLSGYLRKRPNVLASRVRLGISLFGSDERIERDFETRLARAVDQTPELDAAVALAFDGVYDED